MRSSIWVCGLTVFALGAPASSDPRNNDCSESRVRCVGLNGNAEYQLIQDAIDQAQDGDEVVLCEDVYTGTGNDRIDFQAFLNNHPGGALTVRSKDPDDPSVVASTRISAAPRRAFDFFSGETPDIRIEGLTITGVAELGGGIRCMNASSPTISKCVVKDCASELGGAIYIIEGSNPRIQNCTISQNSIGSCNASEERGSLGQGAGIYIRESDPEITDCVITENFFTVSCDPSAGGGIYCENGSPTIRDCTISDNDLGFAYTRGGGIAVQVVSPGTAAPIIEGCTISGNSAARGAGIHFADTNLGTADPIVENCTISTNLGKLGGGGYIFNSDPEFRNCLILNNIACSNECDNFSAGQGGGMRLEGSYAEIVGCTIAGNWAFVQGGGIYTIGAQSNVTLRNTILWGNDLKDDCPNEGPQISLDTDSPGNDGTVALEWIILEGGVAGIDQDQGTVTQAGVILNTDPLFVDPVDHVDLESAGTSCSVDLIAQSPTDYHLTTLSPAVETGNNAFVIPS